MVRLLFSSGGDDGGGGGSGVGAGASTIVRSAGSARPRYLKATQLTHPPRALQQG
jgi:hypothetical protein